MKQKRQMRAHWQHGIRDDLKRTTDDGTWGSRADSIMKDAELSDEFRSEFDTYWIEAGHKIREQIGDDRCLVQLLRHVLPPYSGGAQTLFRGENVERWQVGKIGLNWTPDIEVARMFASGLNSVDSGGVLLQAHFTASAIISGPNAHSRYLVEEQLTADPAAASDIVELHRYPASIRSN